MGKGLNGYWRNIKIASSTLKTGLKVTLKHMRDATTQRDPIAPSDANYFEKENALFTVQYPKEVLPVPEHGRYKLHNEIDDCIVCDKCAKICPVDCIDIEPVRSVGEIGKTSDGTSKRIYAAKFDIDMGKCCFCGLCTTVCPTECLTMTNEYDFSTFDIKEHNFEFAEMTPLEILEKKKEFEEFQAKKAADKQTATPSRPTGKPAMKPRPAGAAKPVFRPKPQVKKTEEQESGEKPKPSMKPKMPGAKKPVMKPKIGVKKSEEEDSSSAKKPVMKPKIQVKKKGEAETKPKLKPKVPMKPKITPKKKEEGDKE